MAIVTSLGSTAKDSEDYWVPRIGVKAQVVEGVDCMVDYSQPWGAHTAPGLWAGAQSNIETKIKSNNYAGTCSYKMDAGKGQLRFIGGVFYQEVDGFKESLVSPLVPDFQGTGRVDLEEQRLGLARRRRLRNSGDRVAREPRLQFEGQARQHLGHAGSDESWRRAVIPIYGSTQYMPDSVELKLQSGIAPGWLAFGSIKWVELEPAAERSDSVRQASQPLAACTTVSPSPIRLTSLDLLYRDGWTVSGGVGHKFNDQWSAAGQLSWDRGTSRLRFADRYLDARWRRGVHAETEHRTSSGRCARCLTSGHSGTVTDENGYVAGTDVTYDFGNDLVTAISGGLKIKF